MPSSMADINMCFAQGSIRLHGVSASYGVCYGVCREIAKERKVNLLDYDYSGYGSMTRGDISLCCRSADYFAWEHCMRALH